MPDFQPVLIFFSPLLQFPWLFIFVTSLSISIGAALCALVVYRKQLIWQRETAERLEDSIQSRTLELQVALTELGEKNRALEARTAELVAEATGEPAKRATLIPDPPNGFEAKPTADNHAAYIKA